MNERILPSYPLFVKDPNFSLWKSGEILNDGDVETWYGEAKPIYGFVKLDGATYCFMGESSRFQALGVIPAKQLSVYVTAFTTDYVFEIGKAKLSLSFVSPLAPTDMQMISMPVCYVNYDIQGADNAEISLFVKRDIAYNKRPDFNSDGVVRNGVMDMGNYQTAFIGLKRQLYLSNNDDMCGADWGYWYLAGERAYALDCNDLQSYLTSDSVAFANADVDKYVAAINKASSGVIMLGYDDIVSIDYYGSFRKGLYLANHTILDALQYVYDNHTQIDAVLAGFDAALLKRADEIDKCYYDILVASLRQSIAAHKLITDENGDILFLSKECNSNGCIATVDVSYPSIPLYLLYNTEFVKGMMRPILKFARMPVWTYDFAPHDAGTYPHCSGNVYGMNCRDNKYADSCYKNKDCQTHAPYYMFPSNFDLYDLNGQMPVEECANMLIMFEACYHYDNDIAFFRQNADLADKWVQYLVKFGLKPANQLCTDDFAGHLANNLNLAIKATVGIACYAKLLQASGKTAQSKQYRQIAESYAKQIQDFCCKYSHGPLTWDSDDTTFSLKYNLLFDKVCKLNLFSQDFYERETDCYLSKLNKFGVPLDSRKTYTKSDWLVWSASLTNDNSKKGKLLSSLSVYLKQTPSRVPFSDWYETVDGKSCAFKGRSVQGGCFAALLTQEKN